MASNAQVTAKINHLGDEPRPLGEYAASVAWEKVTLT
jgi:hypothetical protein